MKIRTRNISYISLVAAILTTVMVVRYADPFFVRALRLVTFDTLLRLNPAQFDPNLPIRIIDIDEESLAKHGQWPWPRTLLRDLALDLGIKGAAAIAFDFLFIEPDRTSADEVAKRQPRQEASVGALDERHSSNDKEFAAALANTRSVLATALLDNATSVIQPKAGFAVA